MFFKGEPGLAIEEAFDAPRNKAVAGTANGDVVVRFSSAVGEAARGVVECERTSSISISLAGVTGLGMPGM